VDVEKKVSKGPRWKR